jgi:hypothetical protein
MVNKVICLVNCNLQIIQIIIQYINRYDEIISSIGSSSNLHNTKTRIEEHIDNFLIDYEILEKSLNEELNDCLMIDVKIYFSKELKKLKKINSIEFYKIMHFFYLYYKNLSNFDKDYIKFNIHNINDIYNLLQEITNFLENFKKISDTTPKMFKISFELIKIQYNKI